MARGPWSRCRASPPRDAARASTSRRASAARWRWTWPSRWRLDLVSLRARRSSSQLLLEVGEEPLPRLAPFEPRKLLEELPLLRAQLHGRVDAGVGQEVAAAAAVEAGEPLAAQAEDLAPLRARRDDDAVLLALQQRHVHLVAQRRLAEGERHGDVQVVAVALEDRVRLHADVHVEVAVGESVRAGLALAAQAQRAPVGNAFWDADVERARALDAPFALARGVGRRDDLAA